MLLLNSEQHGLIEQDAAAMFGVSTHLFAEKRLV